MPSWEALQSVARDRYKQDLPGALKRACENQSAGSTGGATGGVTGINGLATIAYNIIATPDYGGDGSGKVGEWHSNDAPNLADLHAKALFLLLTAPAP